MAGTIQVDLDTLPTVITSLQAIHDAIATQQSNLGSAYTSLQEAVSGTAPLIKTFEDSVTAASSSFTALDSTLAGFISALSAVLTDASNAVSAL